MKVFISSIENKKEDQQIEEMHMTPLKRWNSAFEPIELVQAFSPDRKFSPPLDDSIEWIELKFKNDSIQK